VECGRWRGQMRKLCLCLLLVLSVKIVLASSINEIMYNPSGNDNNLEYVEIISSGFINLSGWIVEDSASDDVLVGEQYVNNDFFHALKIIIY